MFYKLVAWSAQSGLDTMDEGLDGVYRLAIFGHILY